MLNIESVISGGVAKAIKDIFNNEADISIIQVQKTRKEFKGDFTVIVFPLLKLTGLTPEETAAKIGEYLVLHYNEIKGYSVIKGFLNLELSIEFWIGFLQVISSGDFLKPPSVSSHIMVEFSSPNTNKPLHLGHIRNNLIGFSISRILEENGNRVIRANLVNDRGIHICKSMLAWQKWGEGETPGSSGKKGDHLVGDYYVKFETEYKKEIQNFISAGLTRQEAEAQSPLMEAAREMLREWERGDEEIISLWEMMNNWVYEGFEETYKQLGISFDRTYYESLTFSLGKEIVLKGLNEGRLYRKEDGSVWADLTSEGLDHKLLLRSDGTSVYMTQDIGTAHQRFTEYDLDYHIYVVGNEQNYHFHALALALKKLGFEWADKLYHLSYGMVELPDGKMKSREGTVVDADDMIREMVDTARQMANELGKLNEYSEKEKESIYRKIGLGALKYFILKVDPKKNMIFDPVESIDFNGNTGPFIQYTYARIRSVLRKAGGIHFRSPGNIHINEKEISILRLFYEFPSILSASAETFNPSLIANYLYEIAKEYNQFYHEYSILQAESEEVVNFRLLLSEICGKLIEKGMYLLGIEVPERM